MERLPLKARIGPPSVLQERERNSPTDHSPEQPMIHEERERGEISERERSRDRDFRDQDRLGDRPPREDAWRRDDVYVSARAPRPAPYVRDSRDWNRNRDRDRDRDRDSRDEREWTRDTGRERHLRGAGGSWRDDRGRDRDMERDRERFYDRDRDRRPRGVYERPREWRDDRTRDRDRDGRYAEEANFSSSYSRRPEPDLRFRSPPTHARARSPSPYIRHPNSRSPSPRSPPRVLRERSLSRSRDEGSSRFRRRRDDSIDSRRSRTRRGGDEHEQPSRSLRKRERSYSPRQRDRPTQRRLRTTSPSPNSDRRSPSPALSAPRREEKQPERQQSPPPHSVPSSATAKAAYLKESRELKWSTSPDTPVEPWLAQQHPAIARASSRTSVNMATPPSRNSPALSPVVPSEKPIPSGPGYRASLAAPTTAGTTAGAPEPATRVDVPLNTPTGPRSATAQPPPARLPEIPKWRPRYESVNFIELSRFGTARLPLYAEYARTHAAARRATSEADVAAIEFRSAEQRRIFAEQQKQRVLEA